MIYTVTFNPSVDYIMLVDRLVKGDINKSNKEMIYPGGKGINVSLVLSELGHEVKTLGFVAGHMGEVIDKMLREMDIETDFVALSDGDSRINVKIRQAAEDTNIIETDINGQGPNITDVDIRKLMDKLDVINDGDTLVLAGAVPTNLPSNIYEQILIKLGGRNINFVIDATKDLLLNTLKHKPFLIKPNRFELCELFNVEAETHGQIIDLAKKAQWLGAKNVLVSLAEEGALLLCEDGNAIYRKAEQGKMVNSVGAGDSMVAGFLAGWEETRDYEKALSLSVAAGSATAFCNWLANKEQIMSLYAK